MRYGSKELRKIELLRRYGRKKHNEKKKKGENKVTKTRLRKATKEKPKYTNAKIQNLTVNASGEHSQC